MSSFRKISYLIVSNLLVVIGLVINFDVAKSYQNLEESIVSLDLNENSSSDAVSVLNTIPKWNGAYQHIFPYSEDITISKISTGWYEKKNLFFDKIEVDIVNGTNTFLQVISFNLSEWKSKDNVGYFSVKLAEEATKFTKYLFGRKLERMDLNLTGDTRFIFQHLNKDDKYSDVAPITLGDIGYHDPRYSGHITFRNYGTEVQFNDVINQKDICNGYSTQCGRDFSQNPNTWYRLTTSVYGINNYHYTAPNTFDVKDDIYQRGHASHGHSNKYDDNCFILDFQVDVWLIRNVWYVGFYWINSISSH